MWLNYLQLALLLFLPLLFAIPFAVIYWGSLGKPWLFTLASVVGSYLIYWLCTYYLDPYRGKVTIGSVRVNENATDPQERYQSTINGEVVEYFLQPYVWGMVVFILVCVPLLWGLVQLMRRNVA